MTYEIDSSDSEELWKSMLEGERMNFLMTASTRGSALKDIGLVPDFVYTIVAAY